MKNAIYILLGLITAVIGAWQMYGYISSVTRANPSGNMTSLIIAIVCIIAALAFAGLFLASRVNKEEEFHITQ
ncbi:MAG: hypothetical protein ABI954_11640 [Pyrinomonadaceae bacterium]